MKPKNIKFTGLSSIFGKTRSEDQNAKILNSSILNDSNKKDIKVLDQDPKYRIVSAKYLFENNIMETPMLWGHLLQKSGIAVLSGSSDTGKSTLLRQLSLAIVTKQEKFLGFTLNPVHNRVIYISTEDDEYSLSPRIKKEHKPDALVKNYENLTFILDGEDPFDVAKNEFKRMPADCIIIDTWGDYAEGDLNSANNVRTPLKALRSFALTNKCLFIINHHNRKSAADNDISKKNLLGSQSLEAKARVVLMLTLDDDDPTVRKLSVSKGNYIPFELKRKSIVLKTNEDFLFEYLAEVENTHLNVKEVDKRRKENEEAVTILLGKGKKPSEIISELPSLVKEPYKRSAVLKFIKEFKKKSDSESTSILL